MLRQNVIILIGDTEIDRKTAQNAGVKPIVISREKVDDILSAVRSIING